MYVAHQFRCQSLSLLIFINWLRLSKRLYSWQLVHINYNGHQPNALCQLYLTAVLSHIVRCHRILLKPNSDNWSDGVSEWQHKNNVHTQIHSDALVSMLNRTVRNGEEKELHSHASTYVVNPTCDLLSANLH